MSHRTACLFFLFPLLVCLSLLLVEGADEKRKIAFLDAESAGVDFTYQGEYAGEAEMPEGKIKLGMQLIARGEGEFEAVAYKGGLPGEGWDGSEVSNGTGKMMDDSVLVTSKNDVVCIIQEGKARVIDKKGNGKVIGHLQKVVRQSPTLGAKPPEGAVVLFDGSTPDHFEKGRITDDGLLMQGVTSKQKFKDCHLHIEFMLPFMPYAKGQERGNSGCYLQGRYEVQMLDSFGLAGLDNECGAVYSVSPPSVNMCFPPLTWQTYDIDFTAPVYDNDGNKTRNAILTVRHNGVLVQENQEIKGPTRAAPVAESNDAGPLYLQDHTNPVRYRNIWLVEK
ncbi:MAG: DUF1080 domain-containing protein [Planctomycetaceae bacterium]